MNQRKTLLILGAGPLQLPAYKQAKKMNLRTIGVDMNPNAPAFKYADVKIFESTINAEVVLEKVKLYKIDGVTTLATDMPMRTVAFIANNLGLPSIKLNTAMDVTDKGRMRKKLNEKGIPIPLFLEVTNYEEIINQSKIFRGKIIIKPIDSSGSRGVRLLNNLFDIKSVKEAFEYSKQFSNDGKVIVEEFMEGPEVSVESLTINDKTTVIAITDKYTSGAPHFVEYGHSQPSRLSQGIKNQIIDLTKDTIKALNIENSPSHTEIIVTSDGPKIVEIGARLGGDNITTHLVPLSTGINMVEQTIKLALGLPVHLDIKNHNAAAIKYIFSQKVGCIKRIDIPNELSSKNEIVELKMDKLIGDLVTDTKNSSERLGYVITTSDTPEKSLSICEEIISNINIVIE